MSFNGKGQPDWPYGITLNTAASFFSGIMKGMMLTTAAACISQSLWVHYTKRAGRLELLATFDSASRGPWGSLLLLWALKVKQLACVGALLTILSIAIDPTVQQSIVIRTRMIESPQSATIPRALYYVAHSHQQLGDFPQPGFAGAVFGGLYQSAVNVSAKSSDVTPSCPTGNCEYPAFQSLAMCSKCRDLGDVVNKTCAPIVADNYNRTYTHCHFSTHVGLSINQTLMTELPDGLVEQRTVSSNTRLVNHADFGVESLFNATLLHGYTREDGSIPTNLTHCALYWCINTYSSAVRNGTFTETFSNSIPIDSRIPVQSVDSNMLTYVNATIANSSAPTTFILGHHAIRPIWGWIGSKFTFSNTKQFEDSPVYGLNPTLDSSVTITEDGNPLNYDFLLGFQHAESPQVVFRNLAKSITTYLRSQTDLGVNSQKQRLIEDIKSTPGFPAETFIKGTAYQLDVYVEIQWVWLAFSAALLGLTMFFFILVVIQSATGGVAIWKSSPLALLAHGLAPHSQEQLRTEGRPATEEAEVRDLEVRARKMHIKLLDEGTGRFLVQVARKRRGSV